MARPAAACSFGRASAARLRRPRVRRRRTPPATGQAIRARSATSARPATLWAEERRWAACHTARGLWGSVHRSAHRRCPHSGEASHSVRPTVVLETNNLRSRPAPVADPNAGRGGHLVRAAGSVKASGCCWGRGDAVGAKKAVRFGLTVGLRRVGCGAGCVQGTASKEPGFHVHATRAPAVTVSETARAQASLHFRLTPIGVAPDRKARLLQTSRWRQPTRTLAHTPHHSTADRSTVALRRCAFLLPDTLSAFPCLARRSILQPCRAAVCLFRLASIVSRDHQAALKLACLYSLPADIHKRQRRLQTSRAAPPLAPQLAGRSLIRPGATNSPEMSGGWNTIESDAVCSRPHLFQPHTPIKSRVGSAQSGCRSCSAPAETMAKR